MPANAGAAHDVRNDETDESDQPRGGDGRRREQRRGGVDAPRGAIGIDTEPRGAVVPKGEQVDAPRPPEQRAGAEPIIHHIASRVTFIGALPRTSMIAAFANAPTTTPAMSRTRASPRVPAA